MGPTPEEAFFRGLLEVDRGGTDGPRRFSPADHCTRTPCVVTQDGALRFNFPAGEEVEVDASFLHQGAISPVSIFEKREREDYQPFERIFNPRRNKRAWDVRARIERGDFRVFYLFGLVLQYRLDDGDPILVEVRSARNPGWRRQYLFRYHATGVQPVVDVAVVLPLDVGPLPDEDTRVRYLGPGVALTLGFAWNMDPEKRYSWFGKVAHALHPVLVASAITRDVLRIAGEDDAFQPDLMLGAGLTFLDFLFAGYGISVVHSPRVGAIMVGLNVAALARVLARINDTRSSEWDEYMERESARGEAAR